MHSTATRRLSVGDYLEQERLAETKSEFYDGEIFAMAGASPAHNAIVTKLVRHIDVALDRGPCQVFSSEQRTRIPSGLYTYPDVVIVCGKPEFASEDVDTLINPTAIIEVLSPTTLEYDTGRKFRWYQQTPSIQEVAFVSQFEPRFQLYRRTESGWSYEEAAALDQWIQMHTGNIRLSLADIYVNVEFPTDGEAKSAIPQD